MNKSILRKKFLDLRAQYSKKQWHENSFLIIKKLFELEIFKESNNIHTYISLKKEVDTHDIISKSLKLKKMVFCPKVVGKNQLTHHQILSLQNLKKSKLSILEPTENSPLMDLQPDCILIPGLSFDNKGYRLGYGGGYYDNFLKSQKGKKIGLFFDFQFTKTVFRENHDIKLDMVITESKIHYF